MHLSNYKSKLVCVGLLAALQMVAFVGPASASDNNDNYFNFNAQRDWDLKKRLEVLKRMGITAQGLSLFSPEFSKEEIAVVCSMKKLEQLRLCLQDPDADALESFKVLPKLADLSLEVRTASVRTKTKSSKVSKANSPVDTLDKNETCRVNVEGFPQLSKFGFESHVYAFDLKTLLACREHLTALSLHPVAVQGAEYLGQFSALRSLEVGIGNRGTLSHLISYIGSMPKIEELNISCKELTRDDLEQIGKLTALKRLTIRATNTKLQNVDLFFLEKLPGLTNLTLLNTEISDTGIKQLAVLRHLRSLELQGQFRGIGLASLENLPELEEITIDSRNTDKSAYEALGMLRHIKTILVKGSAGVNVLLKPLRQLPFLERFEVCVPHEAADEWLQRQGSLSHLKCCVHVGRNDIGPEGFKVLGEFTQLEELSLRETMFRDTDVPSITQLKKLKNLVLARSRITSKGIEQLPELSALEKLDLQGTKVDESCLHKIAGFSNLQELNLSQTKLCSGEQLAELARLPKLRKLSLSYTKIENKDLKYLASCNVASVDLSGTFVTTDGLNALKTMPNLSELDLENCAILNEGAVGEILPTVEISGIPKEIPRQSGAPWVQRKASQKLLKELNKKVETSKGDWTVRTERASVCTALGKFQEAVNDYDEMGICVRTWSCGTFARFLNEVDFGCFCNRAICHLALGNYGKALSDADTALGLKYYSALARKLRGLAYLRLGDNEKALADLSFAIELNPKSAAPYHYRAELYEGLGQTDKADKDEKMAKSLGYVDEFKAPVQAY